MTGRLRLLTSGMLLLWGVIAVRLVQLQWGKHESLAVHAADQQAYEEIIRARWGDIVDRRGRLLATTSQVYSLFINPSQISDPKHFARSLADALNLKTGPLAERISQHGDRQFLWVKRCLTDGEVEQLLELDLPEEAWGLREEFRRVYPHGTLAAHVLGWRNIDGVPQAGVERTLDELLRGQNGRRTLVRDARGFVIEVLEEVTQAPRHGGTVTLTLDASIQRITEDRLDRVVTDWQPREASAIVLDPQTGEILAMASRPTFDPNAPSAAAVSSWTNHAVCSAHEPGSTIKPCIAAWAVDREIVAPTDTFECRGTYRMRSRELHDHGSFGTLDVTGIITYSSNIGMAQIGERLGNARIAEALNDFGFGHVTGVELPAESAGSVRPLGRWDHFSTGSIPIGQEFSATPVQMIAAHAALANGGTLITPHLVFDSPRDENGPIAVLATTILNRETANWMTTGPMVEVIRHGTGRRAAVEGLSVFGKTGTAQKFDAALGAYSEDRYVTSCICGGPAESPRLLVIVTVDEPRSESDPYGGTVAGPAASDILKEALSALNASSPFDDVQRAGLHDWPPRDQVGDGGSSDARN